MSDSLDDEVIVANAVLDGRDNYEEFDQELDPAKLGPQLVQVNRQKGKKREFQLYGGRDLLITEGDLDGHKQRKYRVNLAWVSKEPRHHRLIDWRWLYASLALGALTATFAGTAYAGWLAMDYAMIGGTICFTLTLLTGLIFAYRLRDEFTFVSEYGGAKLFLLENKRPTQQLFDNFLLKLQQSIDQSRQNLSINERLVGELKMCRRLRDESVIDEETYTTARTLIFKHEQYKA